MENEHLLDSFRYYYSQYFDSVKECRLNGPLDVLIKLEDGSILEYFELFNTIIRLPINSRNISESECRHIFAIRLKYRMYLNSTTQDDLSDMTDISRVMINRYLNERATPSWHNVDKIAKALNCRIEEFQHHW